MYNANRGSPGTSSRDPSTVRFVPSRWSLRITVCLGNAQIVVLGITDDITLFVIPFTRFSRNVILCLVFLNVTRCTCSLVFPPTLPILWAPKAFCVMHSLTTLLLASLAQCLPLRPPLTPATNLFREEPFCGRSQYPRGCFSHPETSLADLPLASRRPTPFAHTQRR